MTNKEVCNFREFRRNDGLESTGSFFFGSSTPGPGQLENHRELPDWPWPPNRVICLMLSLRMAGIHLKTGLAYDFRMEKLI